MYRDNAASQPVQPASTQPVRSIYFHVHTPGMGKAPAVAGASLTSSQYTLTSSTSIDSISTDEKPPSP